MAYSVNIFTKIKLKEDKPIFEKKGLIDIRNQLYDKLLNSWLQLPGYG